MAIELTSIEDVIPDVMFEALKMIIEEEKTPYLPANRLPEQGVSEHVAEQLETFLSTLELYYSNCAWVNFCHLARQCAIPSNSLLIVRWTVADALCTSDVASYDLTALDNFIHIYPAFGDLYIALAGLKLGVGSVDESLRLLEIAELCPVYNSIALAVLKEKVTLYRPIRT